jgi:hypothetical protein
MRAMNMRRDFLIADIVVLLHFEEKGAAGWPAAPRLRKQVETYQPIRS